MMPLPRCRFLFALLGAMGCALPDHGGTWVENKEPFNASTGGSGPVVGGNGGNVELTGGSLGAGGTSDSNSSSVPVSTGGCAGSSSSVTGLGGVGPCECPTGGTASTGGSSAITVNASGGTSAMGGTTATGSCAGHCQVSPASTLSKVLVKLEAGMVFGFRLGYLPASAQVLSLGAVTANNDKGPPARVQFGIYDDVDTSTPGTNLMGYTEAVTVGASNEPTPVDAPLVGNFTTPSKSAFYWVFIVNESASSNVYIEAQDTAQPQGAVYAWGQNCLPFLDGCSRAALRFYGQPNITLPLGYQFPYLYARYVQ